MTWPVQYRARKVSFSSTLPTGLSLLKSNESSSPSPSSPVSSTSTTAHTPITPPLRRSTRSYTRSPYVPTHVRGESTGGDTDVFADSPGGWKAGDDGEEGDKENAHLLSPDGWSRDGAVGSGSPSPSPRKSLPRLDFSRTATPLTARKRFAPRPLAHSPGRDDEAVRKIDFGAAFLASKPHSARSTPMKSVAYSESDCESVDMPSFADQGDGDEEDAEAVDLALGLAGLSVSTDDNLAESQVDTTFAPDAEYQDPDQSAADFVGEAEGTGEAEGSGDIEVVVEEDLVGSMGSNSPGGDNPDLSACSSTGSLHVIRQRRIPTPVDSASDSDSDAFVPRRTGTRSRLRQVVVSDDEDGVVPAVKPKPKGLRGRIPAALARLNIVSESEDDDNVISSRRYPDGGEYEEGDSIGSLRNFINDDETSGDEASDGKGAGTTGDKGASPEVFELLDTSSEDGENADTIDDEDDGMLHFSPPPRLVTLPDLGALAIESSSEDEMPKLKTPKKTPSKSRGPRMADNPREWKVKRVAVAQAFFNELDAAVFDNRLGPKGAGATLEWSAHLRTSAGNASRKRVKATNGSSRLTYRINLSIKVLTTSQQIKDTLAHEMCHLAAWVISNELKNPHGRVFKSWGAKVMRARPDVKVTTKHSYEIAFKYSWRCSNTACAKVYNRHSKSIDTARHACGGCRSRLEPQFETKVATGFQAFLKENMKHAKAAMPLASHGDVMRALSKRWSEAPEGDQAAYWSGLRV